jgi:hypothetical protein
MLAVRLKGGEFRVLTRTGRRKGLRIDLPKAKDRPF